MKNKLGANHNRSLSLDHNNDSLNSSCLSNQVSFFQSTKKPTTSYIDSKSPLIPHKKTKQIHLQSSYTTRNLLEDFKADPTDDSPHKKKHGLSALNASQNSSALKSINILQPESSCKQDSFSRAIDNAISSQHEKERNLLESRQIVEKEIAQANSELHSLQNALVNTQTRFNSRLGDLIYQLSELVTIVGLYSGNPDLPRDLSGIESSAKLELLSRLEGSLSVREVKELVKKIVLSNQNLCKDLSSIEKFVLSLSYTYPADQLDKVVFGSIINQNDEKIKVINDRKRLLIHQIYDAEDLHKQLRETIIMLAEDFHSNVQQLTECVAWQEDLENYMVHLHDKNPECFEKLQNEIENAEKQIILLYQKKDQENILFTKHEMKQKTQVDYHELVKNFDQEQQQYSRYDKMKTLILEDIFKREKTLFYSFYKSFHTYRQQYNLQQLFSYLKLFDINLQALQQESQR